MHPSRGTLIAALLAACLSGCAATTPTGKGVSAPLAQAGPVGVAQSASSQPYRAEDLPHLALSDEILFRILLGDVAAQRGEYPLAFQAWMDLTDKTQDPRAARRAFEIAMGAGQLDEAIVAVKRWVALAPESEQPQQLLLALLIRANRIAEAQPHLIRLLELHPEKIGAAIMQLPRLWQEGSDRAAVVLVHRQVVERYPDVPESHYALAVALAWQGQTDAAIAALDVALKLQPDWPMALLYKAQLLSAAARITFLQQPNLRQNRDAQLLLASTLLETGKSTEARQTYESVLKLAPNDLEALTGAGLLAQYAGDYARSDELFLRALAQHPANADHLRAYLGQSAEMRLQYRAALDWYRQISADSSLKIAARMARIEARLGARDEALRRVAAMPEKTPEEQSEKTQAQAQVLRELKDYQGALRLLNAAITAQPDAHELLLERSLVADYVGDYARGEADLRQYLTHRPGDASALNALGYSLANRSGQLIEAEKLILSALEIDPENPAFIDSLGWLRFRQGRHAEAVTLLAQAHGRFPDPEVSAHYVEALWLSGARAKARSIFDAALQLSPDDEGLLALKKKLGL